MNPIVMDIRHLGISNIPITVDKSSCPVLFEYAVSMESRPTRSIGLYSREVMITAIPHQVR